MICLYFFLFFSFTFNATCSHNLKTCTSRWCCRTESQLNTARKNFNYNDNNNNSSFYFQRGPFAHSSCVHYSCSIAVIVTPFRTTSQWRRSLAINTPVRGNIRKINITVFHRPWTEHVVRGAIRDGCVRVPVVESDNDWFFTSYLTVPSNDSDCGRRISAKRPDRKCFTPPRYAYVAHS
jgi:hypothetical protein